MRWEVDPITLTVNIYLEDDNGREIRQTVDPEIIQEIAKEINLIDKGGGLDPPFFYFLGRLT